MKSTKNLLTLLLVIILMITISCKKDVTDTTDITVWVWKVKSVTTNGKTFKPKKKDYLRNDAYVLLFENDTTFKLNTSVNIAGGNYLIIDRGNISIETYGEFTSVATNNNDEMEFNKNLLEAFSEVTTYKVLGNLLIFKGAKGEVKFKKE